MNQCDIANVTSETLVQPSGSRVDSTGQGAISASHPDLANETVTYSTGLSFKS